MAAVAFLIASGVATSLYDNYLRWPVLWLLPLVAVAGLVLTRVFLAKGAEWRAWFASSATILGCTGFGVGGLYPNLLPSSLDPASSVTAFNAASSPLTLQIMLGVALVMVPIVIAYQAWVYVTFKDRITFEKAGESAY